MAGIIINNPLLFKEGFLPQPLINIWVKYFAEWLKEHEPSFHYELPVFKLIPTYDIDVAYAYKGQGIAKNLYNFLSQFLHYNLLRQSNNLMC